MWSPRKARPASPINRRSQSMQLPANCCGRKAQLDGKFLALCGFGIEPRRCAYNVSMHPHRKSNTTGAIPELRTSCGSEHATCGESAWPGATLTTLYLQFEKEAEAALGLRSGVHSYALLPIGYPIGRFGPVRRIALADVVFDDRWGQPFRD